MEHVMDHLTTRTMQLIDKLFSGKWETVIPLLVNECGRNLPGCEDYTPIELERFHFAVIKLSEGDMDKLNFAIDLAKTDWRDLFVHADFANDINAHNVWINTLIADVKT